MGKYKSYTTGPHKHMALFTFGKETVYLGKFLRNGKFRYFNSYSPVLHRGIKGAALKLSYQYEQFYVWVDDHCQLVFREALN